MRVVHLAQDALPYSTGGVEVYVSRLARELAAEGVDATLLAARDPRGANTYDVRRERHEGVPLTTIGHRTGKDRFHLARVGADFRRFDRNPRIDRMVLDLVRENAPDVIHVHHLVHLSTSLLGTLHRLGVPLVVTLHDYWWLCVAGQLLHEDGLHEPEDCDERCLRYLLFNRHKAFGPFGRLLAAYIRSRRRRFSRWVQERQRRLVAELRLARLVIAPSRSLRERHVGAGLDAGRSEVSDYGTDCAAIPSRVRNAAGSPVRFGFVGRLVPEKGPHLLLEAFRGLSGEATLELHAEPAPHAAYRRELAELAARCGAQFAGPFAPGDAGRILDRLDVLVVPSIWWENSPLVIHEAFAAGIPVIAAAAGGMAELVEHERNGLLFELASAEGLRRAMQRMLAPGTLEKLSRGVSAPRSMRDDVAWHLAAYRRIAAEAR